MYRQDLADLQVVVVDNGSTDGTVPVLSPQFPGVEWLGLPENQGFCAAINRGAAQCTGEWFALLNNDTEPRSDWLSSLLAAARRHPDVRIFASKMVSLRNPHVLDDVGTAYTRSGRAFKVGYSEPDTGQYEAEREVFGACFGAALIHRQVFESLGGLDERFFMYQEDVDFCFRARLAGHRCMYVPTALVGHLGGASSGGYGSPQALRLSARNAVWVVARNMPDLLLRRHWLRMMADWAMYSLYISAQGLGVPFFAGLLAGLRQWPAMRRSGRELRLHARCWPEDLVRLMTVSEQEVRVWRRRRRPT